MMRVAAIVGATAVGKTATGLEVAERLDAEIVSVDSMQIYRGMDIGTAKPTPQQRARVPHHLVDEKDPREALTVAEYQRLGRDAIAGIAARNKLPLLVGGSGLYFRAIVDDLRLPPRSPDARRALEEEVDELGPEALHARLAAVDPVAAARIEPGNARRIVRALEVMEVTGRRFSENDSWDRYESIYDLAVAGLTRRRDGLYARIADRVDEMFAAGFLEEVRALQARGLGITACQALGYRQILEAPPGAPQQQVRDDIVRATKRFARRQDSWFRADPRITWFDASEPRLTEAVVTHLSASAEVP